MFIFHLTTLREVILVGSTSICEGFVVVAPDEEHARRIAASVARDEGFQYWLDRHCSSCRKIGTAEPPYAVKQIILMSDYPAA